MHSTFVCRNGDNGVTQMRTGYNTGWGWAPLIWGTTTFMHNNAHHQTCGHSIQQQQNKLAMPCKLVAANRPAMATPTMPAQLVRRTCAVSDSAVNVKNRSTSCICSGAFSGLLASLPRGPGGAAPAPAPAAIALPSAVEFVIEIATGRPLCPGSCCQIAWYGLTAGLRGDEARLLDSACDECGVGDSERWGDSPAALDATSNGGRSDPAQGKYSIRIVTDS